MTTSEQPDNAQRLREEIEQTREHLGATVEQLAAKADVKSRAQARAAELAGQVTSQARNAVAQARKHAAALAGSVRGPLAAMTAGARQKAASAGQAAPPPVRQAAAQGADAARKYRVPLSAAAAGLLTALAIIIWRRRKR